MPNLLIHPETQLAVDRLVQHTPHATLLIGPDGLGKASIANMLAGQILQTDEVDNHQYIKRLTLQVGQSSIPIEAIRELQHFMSLKVPSPLPINRIAIIEQAPSLGVEAQNALLKLLEEPPQGTVIILTANVTQGLLPTIASRVQVIAVTQPSRELVEQYFIEAGHNPKVVQQASAITGALPGAMQVLLSGDDSHPLYQAVEQARAILQKTNFDKLVLVDSLAKQKDLATQTLIVLQRMAHAALLSGKATSQAQILQWQRVLALAHEAQNQLAANVQTKLVLTNLLLNL